MRRFALLVAILPFACGPVGGSGADGQAADRRPVETASAVDGGANANAPDAGEAADAQPPADSVPAGHDAAPDLAADHGADVGLHGAPDSASDPAPDVPSAGGTDAAFDLAPELPEPDADPDGAGTDLALDAPRPDARPSCPGILCDDFEDGDSQGWSIGTGTAEEWSVIDDGASKVCRVASTGSTSELLGGSASWTDVTIEARVKVIQFGGHSASRRVGLCARYSGDPYSYYAVFLRGDGRLEVRRRGNQLGNSVAVDVPLDTWHTLKLRVSGPAQDVLIEGYLDGVLVASSRDDSSLVSGTVGLAAYGEGVEAEFDDVVVTSP